MQKVYISRSGKVIEAKVIRKTPRGYRVVTNEYGRDFIQKVYSVDPQGHYKTLESKEHAIKDAKSCIDKMEADALEVLDKCTNLYAALMIV